MDPHCITLSPNQRALLLCLIAIWLSYYVIMDAILYSTLQSVPDFIHEKKVPGTMWSPFRPLSVKLIMQDPTTHYVLTPLSEYFNEITRFSDVFYFITPNMITFTHLTLSFVSAKFIVSDSLKSRRIGVLIYELRSWLDAFDGTVFRARAANKKYTSHHSELGFWIDSTSDTIGGFALSFAVLFYFYWKCPPKKELSPLPWTIEEKNGKNGNRNECNGEKHDVKSYKYYTKKFIFWVCFCFGAQVGLASAMWDQTNWKLTDIFNTELSTPELAVCILICLFNLKFPKVFYSLLKRIFPPCYSNHFKNNYSSLKRGSTSRYCTLMEKHNYYV